MVKEHFGFAVNKADNHCKNAVKRFYATLNTLLDYSK
jgi:hypothetical protein